MSRLVFDVIMGRAAVGGRPHYVVEDYAFNFTLSPGELGGSGERLASTSFVIGTIQLEVGIASLVCLYVWGYCPVMSWTRRTLTPPIAETGSLKAVPEQPLIPGISIRLEETMPATVWFNAASGWVCVSNPEVGPGSQAVEFATDTIAVLADRRLQALWVRPENWKELVADNRHSGE